MSKYKLFDDKQQTGQAICTICFREKEPMHNTTITETNHVEFAVLEGKQPQLNGSIKMD